jgi:tetratricopeptide (TPR) repeat protein
MRRLSATHWTVVGAAVICTVLLSFVNTTSPGGKMPALMPQQSAGGKSLEDQVADARKNLNPDFLAVVNSVESSIKTNRSPAERGYMYDSLSHYLGVNKEYVLAAWFLEQKAVNNNGSGADWQSAGERYSSAAGFQQDQGNSGALLGAAMRCFNKALEIEPKNLDAKVGLGMCMVEGTNDPMKGIGLILDVVKEDSTNVNAQLALADFSVQRNAPDLAIKRYKNALALRPDFYGLHLKIADLYQQMGDTASALIHLEKYVEIETDPIMKNNVENAIHSLRKGK